MVSRLPRSKTNNDFEHGGSYNIMKTLRSIAITIGLLTLIGIPALGQGPIYKKLWFDINVPYQLRMTDYILPEGHYILKQVDQNDINLFWLYKDTMTHAPIAVVRTVRDNVATMADTPQKTQLLIRMNERGTDAMPVVRGFTIPGEDPFHIIAVVPKDSHALVRVRQ
jgi:hypothetical protein